MQSYKSFFGNALKVAARKLPTSPHADEQPSGRQTMTVPVHGCGLRATELSARTPGSIRSAPFRTNFDLESILPCSENSAKVQAQAFGTGGWMVSSCMMCLQLRDLGANVKAEGHRAHGNCHSVWSVG